MDERIYEGGNSCRHVSTRRHRPLHEHATADLNVHFSSTSLHVDRDRLRGRLVADHQAAECGADVPVAPTTCSLIATRFEYRINSFTGADPRGYPARKGRREYAVDGNGPNAAGMLPHIQKR